MLKVDFNIHMSTLKSRNYNVRKHHISFISLSSQTIINLKFLVICLTLLTNPSLLCSYSSTIPEEDEFIGLLRRDLRTISETKVTGTTTTTNLYNSRLFNYEIIEESKRGTFVGNIMTDLLTALTNDPKYTTDEKLVMIDKKTIHLSITNWREPYIKYFTLDRYTGELRVAIPPDREIICQRSSLNVNITQQYNNYVTDTITNYQLNSPNEIQGILASNDPCIIILQIAYSIKPISTLKSISSNSIESSIVEYSHQQEIRQFHEPGLINLNILIHDINDNTPQFPQSHLIIELGEITSIPEKCTIEIPTAYDSDSGINGSIIYWLGNNTNNYNYEISLKYNKINSTNLSYQLDYLPFRLENNPLRLILTESLNWEEIKEYNFKIYAKDMGQPISYTGQIDIIINVKDENDNPPTFKQSTYSVSINESALRGSMILELQAYDKDGASNGQLTFSLATPSNMQERLALHYFGIRTISPQKAAIFIIQTPDVDNVRRNSLIERRNKMDNQISRKYNDYSDRHNNNAIDLNERYQVDFIFHVISRGYCTRLDVNDMTPTISLSYFHTTTETLSNRLNSNEKSTGYQPTIQNIPSFSTDHNHGLISENIPKGFIAFVSVQDFDSGLWGQVECHTDNDAFELIPVNTHINGISNNPNSLFPSNYPSDSYPITQSNDGEYEFKLFSTKPFDREKTSDIFFHIVCIDNPQSHYYYKPSPLFLSTSQDESIYQTYTNQYIDQSFSLSIINNQLTGTTLYIFSLEEMDTSVTFNTLYNNNNNNNKDNQMMEQHYHQVRLSNPILIGKVSAIDKDISNQLKYFIPIGNDNDNDISNVFSVDSTDGSVYANQLFDREDVIQKYTLNIQLSKSSLLTTEINSSDQSVYLCFPIYVTDGIYNSSTRIRVLLQDINDNPPIFEKSIYEFYVIENQQPIKGKSLGVLKAIDLDNSINENIIYRLIDIDLLSTSLSSNISTLHYNTIHNDQQLTNSYFTIGITSGQLYLTQKLDREYQSHHIFYVLAIDNDHHSQSKTNSYRQTLKSIHSYTTTATVTVIVMDINDNSPIITYPSSYEVINVEVGVPAGHNLFTVLANDPDAGENGTIQFSLTIPSYISTIDETMKYSKYTDNFLLNQTKNHLENIKFSSNLFKIDETTGIVFVTEKLIYHSVKYLVLITAQDMGYPIKRKTTTTVTIRVQNSNLLQSLNTFKVSENSNDDNDYGKLTDTDKHQIRRLEYNMNSLDSTYSNGYSSSIKMLNNENPSNQLINGHENHYSRLNSNNRRIDNRYINLSDQTIVIILASIFILLFFTTLILVCLIKRRRDFEQRRLERQKNHFNGPVTNIHGTQTGLPSPTSNSLHCSNSSKYNEFNNLTNLYPIIMHDKFDGDIGPRTDFIDQSEDYDSTNIPRIYETSGRTNTSTPNLGVILTSNGYQELYSPDILNTQNSSRRNPLELDRSTKKEQHREHVFKLRQLHEIGVETTPHYQTINSFLPLQSTHQKMKLLKRRVDNSNQQRLPYLTEMTNQYNDLTENNNITSTHPDMLNKQQLQQQTILLYDISATNQKNASFVHDNHHNQGYPCNQSENSTSIPFKETSPCLTTNQNEQTKDEKSMSNLFKNTNNNATQNTKSSTYDNNNNNNNNNNSSDSNSKTKEMQNQPPKMVSKTSSLKRNTTTTSKGVSF
ncbi:unnamed protein product, partial [Heterobilharzia americana]